MTWFVERISFGIPRGALLLIGLAGGALALWHGIVLADLPESGSEEKAFLHALGLGGGLISLVAGVATSIMAPAKQ